MTSSKAGIYVHIPYCKQACSYCNFYFSTNTKSREDIVNAICTEISLRSTEWESYSFETIYFGGGTPSMLTAAELDTILDRIHRELRIGSVKEFTLECNPDDIDAEKLRVWEMAGIDRLSVGVQSFQDETLTLLNRSHDSKRAREAIELALDSGINKMTFDLIFGIPGQSTQQLEENLRILLNYSMTHFSAYSLTIEQKTALAYQVATGAIEAVSDEVQLEQFELIGDIAANAGFNRYEISNYALPGAEAVHNSNYWHGKAYLGIGPSAHSYQNLSRRWNVSNNSKYIKSLLSGNPFWEEEQLSKEDRFNEYLMTRLRTQWGLDTDFMHREYPQYVRIIEAQVASYIRDGLLVKSGKSITLSKKGLFLSDHITTELMILRDED